MHTLDPPLSGMAAASSSLSAAPQAVVSAAHVEPLVVCLGSSPLVHCSKPSPVRPSRVRAAAAAAQLLLLLLLCVCVCACVCMRCVRCGASMFECNRFCVLDGVHNALWVSQAINIEGEWNMLKEAHCEARAAVRLELHYANALRLVGCLGGGPTVVHFAGHCDDINASNRGLVLEQDGEGVVAWVRVALPAK